MEIRKAKDDEFPKCPHCAKVLKEIVVRQIDKKLFFLEKRQVYFCPYCKKTLGVAQLSHT